MVCCNISLQKLKPFPGPRFSFLCLTSLVHCKNKWHKLTGASFSCLGQSSRILDAPGQERKHGERDRRFVVSPFRFGTISISYQTSRRFTSTKTWIAQATTPEHERIDSFNLILHNHTSKWQLNIWPVAVRIRLPFPGACLCPLSERSRSPGQLIENFY